MTQKQLIIFAFAAGGVNVGLLIFNVVAGYTALAMINAASALVAARIGIVVSRR